MFGGMDDTHLYWPRSRRWLRAARDATDPSLRLLGAGFGGLAVLVGVVAAVFGDTGAYPLGSVVAGYALALGAAVYLMEKGYPHRALGLCNLVTLVRLVLVAALAVPLAAGTGGGEEVFALALVVLLLDGLDGWLARRAGLASAFGARFDMEVDSALALVLALHAWIGGAAGALVLVLGLPRYAFAAAGAVLPWLRAPLPERFSRKAVCVLQLGVLVVLQLPALPGWLTATLVAAAALALVWSFWRDVVWLRRQAIP
jgi:phosphatidylglycerophosphate synthase